MEGPGQAEHGRPQMWESLYRGAVAGMTGMTINAARAQAPSGTPGAPVLQNPCWQSLRRMDTGLP